ncbi:MAG: hypothetical protein LC687_03765, partial [Actinobacteria bacterium]|nr:hypothetical protein [Actinomycetota bacterium]
EILRGGTDTDDLECTGYVSERGYSDEMFNISGFTEEIVLQRYLTPVNYGYPLWSNYQTLDTLFNQIHKRYITERVKLNWADYVSARSGVVYTELGVPLDWASLATSGSSGEPVAPFRTSGYIEFRFRKQADEMWERIRWVSDYEVGEEESLTTMVRYKVGADNWSVATAGALTDIRGIEPTNQTGEFLEVRVDFATTDTEVTPRLFALEAIRSKPISEIEQVVYPPSAEDVETPSFDASEKSILDVCIDICEATGWEFRVVRGVLEFSEGFGESRLNDYSLVES